MLYSAGLPPPLMRLPALLSLSLASIATVLMPFAAGAETSTTGSSTSSASTSSESSLSIPSLPASCLANPNKDLCIPDALRNLERLKLDYVNMVARRRQAWIDEHASMGRTAEYLKLLQEFSNKSQKESQAFLDKITAQMRIITAGRTNRRGRGASSTSSSSSSVSSMPIDQKAMAKCKALTDDVKRRICMRAVTNASRQRLTTGKSYQK